jgi:hypothetical protein
MNSSTHVNTHRLARFTLLGFIITFVMARALVFLIMAHAIPNMYLFVKGHTHVHHINYGLFLLSAVAGYAVFRRPTGRRASATALLYGVSMGLVFDEYGMLLKMGGSYWQHTSVDSVILIAAVFGLIAYARSLERFERRHFWASLGILVSLVIFGWAAAVAGARMGDKMGPELREMEASSSP